MDAYGAGTDDLFADVVPEFAETASVFFAAAPDEIIRKPRCFGRAADIGRVFKAGKGLVAVGLCHRRFGFRGQVFVKRVQHAVRIQGAGISTIQKIYTNNGG